jgi:hypothetical protein
VNFAQECTKALTRAKTGCGARREGRPRDSVIQVAQLLGAAE